MSLQTMVDTITYVSQYEGEEPENENLGQSLYDMTCYSHELLFMEYGKDILGKTKSLRFAELYTKYPFYSPADREENIEIQEYEMLLLEMIDAIKDNYECIETWNGLLIEDRSGGIHFYPEDFGNDAWYDKNILDNVAENERMNIFAAAQEEQDNCILPFRTQLC